MANQRRVRLSPSGLEQTPVVRPRRWPWVAGVGLLALLGLAWLDGGERALRPIAQTVVLPGGNG